jgi:hypothetical protein
MRHDRVVENDVESRPADYLRVRYSPDQDGTGKLSVAASAKGYAGVGGAWFDTSHFRDFESALATYPLPTDQYITIPSGFGWRSETDLEQEHVRIAVGPVGVKGQVGVWVHLSTERWPDTRTESVMDVHLELLTTYERLRRFSEHVLLVLDRKLDEAEIGGEELM